MAPVSSLGVVDETEPAASGSSEILFLFASAARTDQLEGMDAQEQLPRRADRSLGAAAGC
jgi:hypothetical protein